MKPVYLLILLALASGSALAKIYQCTDTDGRISYSDQPCQKGINKTLPSYETILEPFVSGRVTSDQKSYPVRNGLVIWDKEKHELQIILTKNPLSDTETQQAIMDDWSFLEQHKPAGLAHITLFFKSRKLQHESLRSMRGEFFGLSDASSTNDNSDTVNNNSTGKTVNLGGDDLTGHVNRLEISQDEAKKGWWIAFSTQEFSPSLRWNINLVLPISD